MEKKNLHIEIQNELRKISPGLADTLQQKSHKHISPGYFDQMQAGVFASLEHESEIEEKVVSIHQKLKWKWLLAAASVIGVILISTFLFLNKTTEVNYDLASLHADEIKRYLLDHAHELDDDHLAQLPGVSSEIDLLELSDEELQPVLEEYLYQIENSELN